MISTTKLFSLFAFFIFMQLMNVCFFNKKITIILQKKERGNEIDYKRKISCTFIIEVMP